MCAQELAYNKNLINGVIIIINTVIAVVLELGGLPDLEVTPL